MKNDLTSTQTYGHPSNTARLKDVYVSGKCKISARLTSSASQNNERWRSVRKPSGLISRFVYDLLLRVPRNMTILKLLAWFRTIESYSFTSDCNVVPSMVHNGFHRKGTKCVKVGCNKGNFLRCL